MNPWHLRYRRSALSSELTSQLGVGHYVVSNKPSMWWAMTVNLWQLYMCRTVGETNIETILAVINTTELLRTTSQLGVGHYVVSSKPFMWWAMTVNLWQLYMCSTVGETNIETILAVINTTELLRTTSQLGVGHYVVSSKPFMWWAMTVNLWQLYMCSTVGETNIETILAVINTTELLRTNPASSMVEGLNLGPSVYTNSAALINWPHCLHQVL